MRVATPIGQAIRAARTRRRWTRETLAEQMSCLCPEVEFTHKQVERLEGGRNTFRARSDKTEPVWWALRAVGVSEEEAVRLVAG